MASNNTMTVLQNRIMTLPPHKRRLMLEMLNTLSGRVLFDADTINVICEQEEPNGDE